MAYDLLIKNGRIVDGSGMPSFTGDVAVKDGKIAEIGKLSGNGTRLHQPVDRLAYGAVATRCDNQLGAVHSELPRQVAGLARTARLLDVELAELARQQLLDLRPSPPHATAARDGIDDDAHGHALPFPLRGPSARLCA